MTPTPAELAEMQQQIDALALDPPLVQLFWRFVDAAAGRLDRVQLETLFHDLRAMEATEPNEEQVESLCQMIGLGWPWSGWLDNDEREN